MRILGAFAFFAALLAFPAGAQARVFDLSREKFASYLLFTYGPSSKIGDAAYADEQASSTTYDAAVTTNVGGEFGFVYATKILSWRFGFEILKPAPVTAVASNGGDVYSVKSDITGFLPKVGVEINVLRSSWYRMSLFGYAGQTSVTVQNDYSNVTVPPSGDFAVKYKGNCNTQGGGLMFEMAAFDTSTLVLEAGYRKMAIDNLTYASDVASHFGTARSAGDDARRLDGNAREIDFTGAYVSAGFRFYLF